MKKGIMQIFLSNVIFLIFGILNNLILPKYLSVNSYAMLKTYMLYISYASFLGFGFIEGMFLLYGGKTLEKSSEMGFGEKFKTYLVIESFVALILLVLGIINKNWLIILCALGIFITNIVNYFKNYAMAVAEYKLYSVTNSFEKIALLLFNVILIFQIKSDNYISYICVLLVIGIAESFYFIYKIKQRSPDIFKGKIEISQAKITMSMGIILLLGNGISSLFIGIDQWFVKILMNNNDFALYAFAVSLQRLIALLITPITRVLYNFFCRKRENDDVSFLHDVLVLWGFLILIIVFPLNWFVEAWIPKYVDALKIIAFLFCSESLSGIINGIYVNLYKAKKQQNKFLHQMVVMTLISILLNGIFYFVYNALISIAIATLITKFIWILWCEMDLRGISYALKGNLAILLLSITFVMTSFIENWVMGGIIYVVVFFLIASIFIRKAFMKVLIEVITLTKNRIRFLN
jgi:O-antigen/teichoic acid export membrane protein